MSLMRLRILKESGKKKLPIIPFIFTFANACLGLLAVLYALDGQFVSAAYSIIAAALFDGFDGRLARAFGSTSSLGMELDSLCDAISFCFAPAIILYSWRLNSIGYIGFFAVGLYLCAGLFRLAKFHITSDKQRAFFIGLPTTSAAAFVASLVMSTNWLGAGRFHCLLNPYNLTVITVILSLLMLSRVRFPSFKSKRTCSRSVILITVVGWMVVLYAVLHGFPFWLTTISLYVLVSLLYYSVTLFLPMMHYR